MSYINIELDVKQYNKIGIFGTGAFGHALRNYIKTNGKKPIYIDNNKSFFKSIYALNDISKLALDVIYIAIGDSNIAIQRKQQIEKFHSNVHIINPALIPKLKIKHTYMNHLKIFFTKCHHATTFRMRSFGSYEYYKHEDYIREEIYKYEIKKTIVWKEHNKFSNRLCPICKSSHSHLFFYLKRNNVNYSQCDNCSFVYTNPYVDETSYSEIYIENYNGLDLKRMNYRNKHENLTRSNSIAACSIYQELAMTPLIYKYHTCQNASLLDFGCGYGGFIKNISSNFTTYGMDIDTERLKIASENSNANIINYLDIDPDDYYDMFDIITSDQNLEHLLEPKKYLELFYKWLKNEGILVVSVPNSGSLVTKLLKEDNSMFDLGHVSMFNKKSMLFILNEIGFDNVEIKTFIPDVSIIEVFKKFFKINFTHRYSFIKNDFVYYLLYPMNYIVEIILNLLIKYDIIEGSYMIIVAKK